MNSDEQLDYVEAVDELRRLQIMTPRPMLPLQAKKIAEQEARVDKYTARFLERLTRPSPASTSTA